MQRLRYLGKWDLTIKVSGWPLASPLERQVRAKKFLVLHFNRQIISIMEYIGIIIFAVFVNNVVLAQFLGICPFLGVSNKVSTATGMGAAVVFVMTLATLVTYILQTYVLTPFNLIFSLHMLFDFF